MRVLLLAMAVAGVCVLPAPAQTPDDTKARIQRIEDSVLAPCCYAEPVSRHQSEIAVKMRVEIAKWVSEGKTDREILDAYVRQYGSAVLVDPRTIPGWWTPWIPWLTVILSVIFGFWLLQHWRAKQLAAASASSGPDLAELPKFDDDEE